MPPFQKPETEIGAGWEKTSSKGNTFISMKIDCEHSPQTAFALANMLLSGQPLTFLASVNSRASADNTKIPKYSMYMSKEQHAWMVATYNRVYDKASAPVFDYRNPTPPAQQQYAAPTPPMQNAAPAQAPYAPPTPYPPQQQGLPHAHQMPPAPVPPAPASPTSTPANPFGA